MTREELQQWLDAHNMEVDELGKLLGYKKTINVRQWVSGSAKVPVYLPVVLKWYDGFLLDAPKENCCPFCGVPVTVSNGADASRSIIRHPEEINTKRIRDRCPLSGYSVGRSLETWNRRGRK